MVQITPPRKSSPASIEMRQSMPIVPRRPGGPSRGAVATAAIIAATTALSVFASAPANASGRGERSPITPVTRAAIDPALSAGRGAAVGFAEQEAEKATTTGTVIGPDTTAYTLPAEAS